MNTMHLKDPLVFFGFEVSALSLPRYLLSHALPLFFNNGKGPLYEKKTLYGTERPTVSMCLLIPHSFHAFIAMELDNTILAYSGNGIPQSSYKIKLKWLMVHVEMKCQCQQMLAIE